MSGRRAIALLHIPDPPFRRALIERYRFKSIGTDAIVVELGAAFVGFELRPARVAEDIEALIGEAIDAHDDPRGILFAPESWVPTGTSYVTAVASIERGKLGKWAAHEGASLETQRDHELIELVEALGGTCEIAGGGILRAADLRNTPVTAAQLEVLARGELESLAVGGTARAGGGLSRQGLSQLSKFRTLRTLRISRLALTDTDLAVVVPLASLETLELERAPILGGGFERLAVLAKSIDGGACSYCKIDDDGMESVAALPALRVLDLEPANITDAIKAALAGTKQAQRCAPAARASPTRASRRSRRSRR